MLHAATARFARSALAGHINVVVADALIPFVPSLLAIGCSDQEIRQFIAALTAELAPLDLAWYTSTATRRPRWPVPPPGKVQNGCSGTPASSPGTG